MQEKLYTGYYFVTILQKGKLKHIFLVCGESHLVDSIIGHFAQMISATFPFSRSPHIDTSYVFHGLLRGETFLYINQAWRAFLDIFVSKSFTIRVFKRNGHLPSCLNGLTVEVASRNIFPPFPPILTPRTSSWPRTHKMELTSEDKYACDIYIWRGILSPHFVCEIPWEAKICYKQSGVWSRQEKKILWNTLCQKSGQD